VPRGFELLAHIALSAPAAWRPTYRPDGPRLDPKWTQQAGNVALRELATRPLIAPVDPEIIEGEKLLGQILARYGSMPSFVNTAWMSGSRMVPASSSGRFALNSSAAARASSPLKVVVGGVRFAP